MIRKFGYVVTIGIVGCITSCASNSDLTRGSLSDAVEKSSVTYKGERRVVTTEKKKENNNHKRDEEESGSGFLNFMWWLLFESKSDDDLEVTSTAEHCVEDPPPPAQVRTDQLGMTMVGLSFPGRARYHKALQPAYGAEFRLSHAFFEKSIHSFSLGFSKEQVRSGHELHASAKDMTALNFGYMYRYAMDRATNRGPFFSLGMEFRYLTWDYLVPFTSDLYNENVAFVSTETITHDGIGALAPEVGFGYMLPFLSDLLSPSLELRLGVSLFNDKTSKLFENDIFGSSAYAKLLLSFDFSW